MKKEMTLNEEDIQRIYRHLKAAKQHYEMMKDFIRKGRLVTSAGPALSKDEKDVDELIKQLEE